MFSNYSNELVCQLLDAEKEVAEQYGTEYNSNHEAYAVILEEVDESEHCFERFRKDFACLWEGIKLNENRKALHENITDLEVDIKFLILELAQVGACLKKFEGGVVNE